MMAAVAVWPAVAGRSAWADVLPMTPPTFSPLPATQPAETSSPDVRPLSLSIPEPESVYLPPSAGRENEGVNGGAMHYHLDVSFLNRYIYRGVDQSTNPDRAENALQFNGTAEMDLGNLPHPFVGLFSNIFDQDPVSRFEEVRPYLGLHWLIKPLTITGGYNDYIFPNREKTSDTQEAFASLGLDDSRIWNTDQPILSPFIYGAYDFERYHGAYMEVGARHDFEIGDSGVTLSPQADVAYVLKDHYFRKAPFSVDSGWQHYEVGLVGSYLLNQGLGFSKRYGTWKVVGYLFYDEALEDHVRADTRLWGGVGLSFDY
jgi:hypothetical protein